MKPYVHSAGTHGVRFTSLCDGEQSLGFQVKRGYSVFCVISGLGSPVLRALQGRQRE